MQSERRKVGSTELRNKVAERCCQNNKHVCLFDIVKIFNAVR